MDAVGSLSPDDATGSSWTQTDTKTVYCTIKMYSNYNHVGMYVGVCMYVWENL